MNILNIHCPRFNHCYVIAYSSSASQLQVKRRIRTVLVRTDPENAKNAGCESAQNFPSEEGQVIDKGVPFMASHHFFGSAQQFRAGQLRFIREQIRHHPVFVYFDDARHHQQQAEHKDQKIS